MGIPNKEKEAAHRGAKALRDSGTGAGAPSQFSSPEDLDLNLSLISPSEVNHLKRIHGTDTFPVLSTMLEESEYVREVIVLDVIVIVNVRGLSYEL